MSRQGENRKRQHSSNIKSKFDVELPKINKTIFSAKDKDNNSFLPTTYSEKTNWVIEPVDYSLYSEPQIEAEYKKLRKQLNYINQQVARAVNKLELKPIKKGRPEIQSSKVLEIRDKEIDNNCAIIQRLTRQHQQLQKRVNTMNTLSKDDLEDEINKSKDKIITIKAKIKQLKLRNKTVGTTIVNSDQIFEEIKRLETEKQLQERKKHKLQTKTQTVGDSITNSEHKLLEISDHYEEAEIFFNQYDGKTQQEIQLKQLQEKYKYTKHCLEVNQKKNQSQNNSKQQKYHLALKQLEHQIERIDNAEKKSNQHQLSIINSKKIILQLQDIIKNWENQSRLQEPAFFTQLDASREEKNEKSIDQKIDEKKPTQQKVTQRIDTNQNIDPEEDKDTIMELDEKFKYKTRGNLKSRANETQTEMGDKKSQIQQSCENSEDAQIIEFKSKVYEHKSKLAEKKEFNIDLSSVEDNIKKMDSMQLNKHEVVRKSKENVYDLSD